MTTEKDTVEIWNTYGAHQITRGLQMPELDRWDWGIPERGPGINALGEVAGLRVLDLGSGLGRHAANLADLGAKVTAVDTSPAQRQRALTRYPDHPGLHLVCADAVAHLRAADSYDLIYSVCSVPYLDPNRLLPALANGLKPGVRLVFSALRQTPILACRWKESPRIPEEVYVRPAEDIEFDPFANAPVHQACVSGPAPTK
ncbi:class I SAM-dependent methyltransferase [Streptomyces sp. NPDC048484]|uniref:class I SAM-dependent methyltransferase n=1 Tax=Streptomyces sp. NPDC048484 TaxID=3155146 RepID=UPI00342552A6